jgi:uncharacterized protein involved in outer membrane biogenesis
MINKKTLLGILIALLLLIPLVLIGILMSLDFNQYKPEVKALTGRKLTIDGDLELSISLTPRIEVNGVSLVIGRGPVVGEQSPDRGGSHPLPPC